MIQNHIYIVGQLTIIMLGQDKLILKWIKQFSRDLPYTYMLFYNNKSSFFINFILSHNKNEGQKGAEVCIDVETHLSIIVSYKEAISILGRMYCKCSIESP